MVEVEKLNKMINDSEQNHAHGEKNHVHDEKKEAKYKRM